MHLAAVPSCIFLIGTPAAALHLTNNKPRASNWCCEWPADALIGRWRTQHVCRSRPHIIKAVWEHASVGLDDHAVITSGDGSMVCDQIVLRSRQLGQACFAERYVKMRINFSLIAAER